MCDVCRQTPCHPRCPNAEIPIFDLCEKCGAKIYDGDDYFEVDGNNYCEDCVSHRTAEV